MFNSLLEFKKASSAACKDIFRSECVKDNLKGEFHFKFHFNFRRLASPRNALNITGINEALFLTNHKKTIVSPMI